MHEKANLFILFICNRKKNEIQICSNKHETGLVYHTGIQIRVCILKSIFSYFSTKTYVVGTQRNCLSETILFSTRTHVLMDG